MKKDCNRTPNVKCENCGKGLYRRPWQLKKGLAFISCRPCLSIVRKNYPQFQQGLVMIPKGFKWSKESVEKRSGKNSYLWRGGRPKCADCKEELQFTYKQKRCRDCYTKYAVGESAANWRGGKLSENQIQREKFKRDIHNIILRRDNYACQMCGSKKYLQVDHIQKWSEYVELRFSMDNCRTVCRECHYLITFGKPIPKNSKWGIPTPRKEVG